jgi:hypothetical protein
MLGRPFFVSLAMSLLFFKLLTDFPVMFLIVHRFEIGRSLIKEVAKVGIGLLVFCGG